MAGKMTMRTGLGRATDQQYKHKTANNSLVAETIVAMEKWQQSPGSSVVGMVDCDGDGEWEGGMGFLDFGHGIPRESKTEIRFETSKENREVENSHAMRRRAESDRLRHHE
jgi:hypothetical protein